MALRLIALWLFLLPLYGYSQQQLPALVVLGVNHSSQLVNPNQQPAVLRAFMERVRPAAICIERDPEHFALQDFYEFTYEQQSVIVPYARANKIPLFPIDWHPQEKDLQLAYGTTNMEVPPFTRNPAGFWGFLAYDRPEHLREPFFFADDTGAANGYADWYARYDSGRVHQDFARRLFLYRTFLQARRVEAAAKPFGDGDTLLVVIGAMHKAEIELYLRAKGFPVIPASRYGPVRPADAGAFFQTPDAYAILSFNLLGVQARTGNMDTAMVAAAMQPIARDTNPEAAFFAILYQRHTKSLPPRAAITRLLELQRRTTPAMQFTWTGVKYRNRLDSYFDPFGNMSLAQRLRLELARLFLETGDRKRSDQLKQELVLEMQGLKKAMLLAYWPVYVEGQ